MRNLMLQELAHSRRIIEDFKTEVVPRFRVSLPDDDVTIYLPLPDDLIERFQRFELVSKYMTVKLARAFTLAIEALEPDALLVVGVERNQEAQAVMQVIDRGQFRFGEPEWLPASMIDDSIMNLLPARVSEVSADDVATVEAMIAACGIEPVPVAP